MNNNENREQELRQDAMPVCPEEEKCVAETAEPAMQQEAAEPVEETASAAEPEEETASVAQDDTAPQSEAQQTPVIPAGAEAAEGLTVEQALNNIYGEVETLERAAEVFSEMQPAQKHTAAQSSARKPAPDRPEDYFSPIERIFASRPVREDPEPEKIIFYSGENNATVTVKGDEDVLRWFVNGMNKGDWEERKNEPAKPAAKGRNGKGKVFSTFLCLLAALLVMGGVAYYILCAHGLRAIISLKEVEVNANVYSMSYSGSYGLDDLIAQGGASTDRELMDFLGKKFSFGLVTMPDIIGGSDGSSDGVLSVLNSDCEDRRALTGRSHSSDGRSMSMIVSTRQSNGRETVTTVDIGRLGYTPYNRPGLFNGYAALAALYLPLDGMNDYGLCVTAIELPGDPRPVTDTDRPDLTVTAAVRMLLDYTSSVENAVGMLGRFDIYPSFGRDYHLVISDLEGNTAVIEWYDGQMYRINTPCASNERIYSPDGAGAAGFETQTGRMMTLLSGSYSKYDGHMTLEQMTNVIGRASTGADGWGVVYDTYTDTAYFRFEGETEKQVTVSMSPAY